MTNNQNEREQALATFKKLWKPGHSGMYHLDKNAAYDWCAANCEVVEEALARSERQRVQEMAQANLVLAQEYGDRLASQRQRAAKLVEAARRASDLLGNSVASTVPGGGMRCTLHPTRAKQAYKAIAEALQEYGEGL